MPQEIVRIQIGHVNKIVAPICLFRLHIRAIQHPRLAFATRTVVEAELGCSRFELFRRPAFFSACGVGVIGRHPFPARPRQLVPTPSSAWIINIY